MVLFSSLLSTVAIAATSFGVASAHPHPQPGTPEFIKRENFNSLALRGLANCQDQLRKRGGIYERARVRREALAHKARRDLNIRSMG